MATDTHSKDRKLAKKRTVGVGTTEPEHQPPLALGEHPGETRTGSDKVANPETPPDTAQPVRVHPPHSRPPNGERHKKLKKLKPRDIAPEDRAEAEKIRGRLERQDQDYWEIGDSVLALTGRLHSPLTLRQVTEVAGNRHKSTLSRASIAARNVPKASREGLSVFDAYQLTLVARDIRSDLTEMIPLWLEARGSQASIRKFFFDREKCRRAAAAREKVTAATPSDIAGKAVLGSWEDHLDSSLDGNVKAIFADPPFAQYGRGNGGYTTGHTTPLRTAAANDSADSALATTLHIFEHADRLLRKDGVVILFQAGLLPDRPEVLDAASKHGMVCRTALEWVKDLAAMQQAGSPYASGTERILVFHRKGDRSVDHSSPALPLGKILYCPSPSQLLNRRLKAKSAAVGDGHIYQKPIALYEYLILKHTHPGELILDLYGCTGANCMAAVRRRRDFRYFEAVEENYNAGVDRIRAALEGERTETYDLPESLAKYNFPPTIVDVRSELARHDQELAARLSDAAVTV